MSGKDLILQLKKIRQQKKITQEDMAHRVGVRMRTLQRWEKGNFEPSRLAQEKIRKAIEELKYGND